MKEIMGSNGDLHNQDQIRKETQTIDEQSGISVAQAIKTKFNDFQVQIPKPLIHEVDKVVTKSGLYSDRDEFVKDAVRRLVMESKK